MPTLSAESVTFGTNSISYGYEVDYEAIQNDNLGNPYPTGQTNQKNNQQMDTITYTPNSKIFYGVSMLITQR